MKFCQQHLLHLALCGLKKKKNNLIFLKVYLNLLIQVILQKHILKKCDQTLNIYDEVTTFPLKGFCKSRFKILNHLMLEPSFALREKRDRQLLTKVVDTVEN